MRRNKPKKVKIKQNLSQDAWNFNFHIFIVSISCLTLRITKLVQPLATMLLSDPIPKWHFIEYKLYMQSYFKLSIN